MHSPQSVLLGLSVLFLGYHSTFSFHHLGELQCFAELWVYCHDSLDLVHLCGVTVSRSLLAAQPGVEGGKDWAFGVIHDYHQLNNLWGRNGHLGHDSCKFSRET